jgi:hypothetical protein
VGVDECLYLTHPHPPTSTPSRSSYPDGSDFCHPTMGLTATVLFSAVFYDAQDGYINHINASREYSIPQSVITSTTITTHVQQDIFVTK